MADKRVTVYPQQRLRPDLAGVHLGGDAAQNRFDEARPELDERTARLDRLFNPAKQLARLALGEFEDGRCR